MRWRSFAAGGAAVLLAAGLTWAYTGTAAAASDRYVAVCEHRLCLIVLDLKADRDGDGVTDLDELQAGTDPDDRFSYPGAPQLLDLAIDGKLTSFERHLTELVVLPKNTPDGNALATGFGAFPMPAKGWLYGSPGQMLTQIRGNGFTGITDVLASVARPNTTAGNGMPPWGPEGGIMLIGAGEKTNGVTGPTNWGPNGTKQTSTVVGGGTDSNGAHIPEFQMSTGEEGTGGDITVHTYTVNYADGSRDNAQSTNFGIDGGTSSITNFSSYDGDGHKISDTRIDTSQTKDPKSGDSSASYSLQTTYYDKEGKVTGSVKVETSVTVEDGVKTTTQSITTFDADGKQTATKTVTKTESVATKDHEYLDPEYVSAGPITGADVARVITRINSVRTPGPDTGVIYAGDSPPRKSPWPLVALINPDGVVSIAVGATPTFNRTQPDYDPHLSELAGHAGVGAPKDNGHGGVSWPDEP